MNSDLKYCYELLVHGDRLGEHEDRFQPNGKYVSIPTEQWLLVDFFFADDPGEKASRLQKRDHRLIVVFKSDMTEAHWWHQDDNGVLHLS